MIFAQCKGMRRRKLKISKKDVELWLIIVLLGIYIYLDLNFLTTFSDWWIVGSYCGVLLIVMLLTYLLGKSIEYLKAIKISAIAFLGIWNIIYIYGYCNISTHKTINVTVPLSGYYTGRIDGVLFSFKGYKFNRSLNLADAISKYGEELPNKCELELSLSEVFTNFYYINYIDVVENYNKSRL